MICLLVMTDGRDDLLERTLASFEENVTGPVTTRVLHVDDGQVHAKILARRYPDFTVIGGSTRVGFGRAIGRAWGYAAKLSEEYVFHLEDDFTFNRRVNLHDVARVLETHLHLAQLALRRQPWNDAERAAGGVVEMQPDAYEERAWGGCAWLEHRLFWTTNPSLVPYRVVQRGWPSIRNSEGVFTHALLKAADLRFGYWGARDDEPWVEHIGEQRVGTGY